MVGFMQKTQNFGYNHFKGWQIQPDPVTKREITGKYPKWPPKSRWPLKNEFL